MKQLFNLLLLLISTSLWSAELQTYELKGANGKTIVITRDIPDQYFGTYHQKGGQWEWKFQLNKDGSGYFWEQSHPVGKVFWDEAKKMHFETWGIWCKDGKKPHIYTKKGIMYFGKKINDEKAMFFLFKDKKSGKLYEYPLYHHPDGKPVIKWAEKVK